MNDTRIEKDFTALESMRRTRTNPAMNDARIEKDFSTLEHMRRARMNFTDRICAASVSQAEDVLEPLRAQSMFEFAEFYFAIKAMDLYGADDIGLLADMHNRRIDDLLRNTAAMAQRKLKKDRLLDAIFTSDTRPRLEHCWRETPGALEESNLARFLVVTMSAETTRKLIVAAEAAGFLTRRDTVFGTKVVESTGVMEDLFGQCMREMREAIEELPSSFERAIRFYTCFISYSTKDQDFADRLHADLQNKGVRCWFAPHDLPIGGKILDEIDAAIRVRDKVVLILSKHSIRSGWVEDEVKTAFEEERKRGQTVLFPLRLDDAVMDTKEAWAAKLRADRNIGDFRRWKEHDAYQRSFERAVRDLTAPPKAP